MSGNIVVTEVQLGGVSTATYAQSSSAMASAQSKVGPLERSSAA